MKALAWVIFTAVLLAVLPAAAADKVTVPNLVGMKNGNDVIGILTSLKLKWTFGDQQLPPNKDLEFTVAAQSPAAGTQASEGDVVAVVAYGRYAPFVVGLTLDKAAAKLEKAGLHPGVTVCPHRRRMWRTWLRLKASRTRAATSRSRSTLPIAAWEVERRNRR
jgi:beta-lactam-binding protein with PASTA domain